MSAKNTIIFILIGVIIILGAILIYNNFQGKYSQPPQILLSEEE